MRAGKNSSKDLILLERTTRTVGQFPKIYTKNSKSLTSSTDTVDVDTCSPKPTLCVSVENTSQRWTTITSVWKKLIWIRFSRRVKKLESVQQPCVPSLQTLKKPIASPSESSTCTCANQDVWNGSSITLSSKIARNTTPSARLIFSRN